MAARAKFVAEMCKRCGVVFVDPVVGGLNSATAGVGPVSKVDLVHEGCEQMSLFAVPVAGSAGYVGSVGSVGFGGCCG